MIPVMATDYFIEALDRYRVTRAAELGCAPEHFDDHSLVIVERPAGAHEPLALIAVTFGTGTVVSVVPQYLDWVKAHAPAMHYRVMFPPTLLAPLVEEAKSRGESLAYRSPNLSFLPGSDPVAISVPPGFAGRRVDRVFHDLHVDSNEFDNALGEAGHEYVASIWKFGFVLFAGDSPAAVAGAYDDGQGMLEIGVDVARPYRGLGLAPVVVTNLARLIADEGSVATYYCGPTNIRSHRNALTCGFVPVASAVRVAAPGM
jgi:hypothetical protein